MADGLRGHGPMSATWVPAPQTLRTARLLLRCPRPGDGARVHAAVVESLADLRVWSASVTRVRARLSGVRRKSVAHCATRLVE